MASALPDKVKNVITDMRERIQNKMAVRIKQDTKGWEYGGPALKELALELKDQLNNEGYDVRGCTVWHFLRGANIKNPTKGLILLLISGEATLSPGGALTLERLSYIKDEPSLLTGANGADVVFVVIEPDGEAKTSDA
ncbi:uncharacterized protein BO80DRAFT_443266 [Aspergillus ibericus CBS 121593]|uniref:Uncharacterized protein n=1 Tax=Aspergillus ibericus CBS 121593 TaxID=1448316 RepID=A0A395H771_9EURO|nr:hypothetical protein BO80DRAFT_443266 [Aspergillus ibericus CBS 121593]RAL03015.1 hypothetical protein BO80DRAFT_443266 [Aspergillus ibericus CBS 121593]